ncbi:MAG: DUF5702 domain-containing protein [Eubacteriales bacterium]|nr:DUF5702 domain-containing protein [Eubacteriales bacterium]
MNGYSLRSAGKRQGGQPGYMTVYLALVMGVLLSLILAAVTAARISTIRMHIECSADMALDSALAEYHREMLEQYELFFIDTSYGTGDPSYRRTEEHILSYMERNLRPQEEFSMPGARDITGLSACSAEILRAGVATDGGGSVLKYHVVEYMKDINGISLAEQLLSWGSRTEGFQGRDVEAEWDEAEAALKEEITRKKRLEDEEWDGDIPETPSDAVRSTRGEGILGSAAQGMKLSGASVSGTDGPSVRRLKEGTGLSADKEPADGLLANGLLYAYILDKCGYFGREKEEGALAYQVEYILQRETQDRENLRKTLRELLLIREAANVSFLFGSSLRSQASGAAGVIASILLMPEIAPAVETVILFAWAYAESVKDIRILLKGDKVPVVKTEGTWNTPFSQLLTYRSHLDSYGSAQEGLSYRDYLGTLLFLHGSDSAVKGLMDVMESDIRRTPGNGAFRIDGLIDGMEARITLVSDYTGSYEITRKYEYE